MIPGAIQAQPPGNNREAGQRRASQEFLLSQELTQHLQAYQSASGTKKEMLRAQVEQTLYEMFDLSIVIKEAEVAEINQQIEAIKNSDVYRNKNQEIEQLENALQRIQGSINFRKANRDKIVAQRLREILEG